MSLINYLIKERIGYITLNRPDKRNALNAEMVSLLKEAFSRAEADTSVKVVVLKAEGDVFCAGADLEYLQQLQKNTYDENLADSTHLMELFKQIYTLKKVVIAQINGHAIAGGAGLASVCDIAFSSPEANFGYTEVKIGFIPAIVMVFLIRKIGETKTKELLLSGNLIDSKEAQTIGLINFLSTANSLEEDVFNYAQKLCNSNSDSSMQLTKQMIAELQNMKLDDGLNYAAKMNANARSTEDCKKGINSFLNKEKLTW